MLDDFLTALCLKPVHQSMQKRCARPPGGLSLRKQPVFEVVVVRDRESFQEFATELRRQIEQTFRGKRISPDISYVLKKSSE